jgi:putative FmdB family regulatory protein
MPTYDYECPKGHRFEAVQKMTARPVATCPKCKARARRVISAGGGFLLKGEGFYKTDYRSEDYKKKASAESGSSSEKGADGKKSDAKPETAKAEAKSSSKSSAKSSSASSTRSED